MTNPIFKRLAQGLAALAAAVALAAPAAAQEAAGDWIGLLEPAPGARLPLIVHVKRDAAGALSGTMDSPAQGVQGLPLAGVEAAAGSLAFTVPSIGGGYRGHWEAAAKSWKGEWRQAGMRWPLSLAAPPPPRPLPADWSLPSDLEIAKLIAERNAPRPGQEIVIGVLGPEGRRIVAGGAKADRDALFEIGSITKVFTALILADMADKGEVSLDDPISKYLPKGHRAPERGRPITLRDLATHRSGLPRMADNMGSVDDPDGPFAGYTEARLLAFLDRVQLTRDVGAQWDYSNVGGGLLAYLLGRAAGSGYPTLLRARITGPLHMDDTMIALAPPQAARLAPAFDAYMRPTRPWDLGIMAGAGGVRSTAADMLTFAKAALDPKSPIAAAMKTALAVRGPTPNPSAEQALGWQVLHPAPGREFLLHDGETGGFRSILLLEPATGRAVVALDNTAVSPTPVDLALHILIGTPVAPTPAVPPPPPPPTKRTEIALPAAALEKVVGRYDFGPGFVIAVTRDGDALYAQREGVPGASPARIFPEAPLVFFWKTVDAQIRFVADASGKVTGAEFKQGAMQRTGRRLGP